jgi:hypothetical protein
VNELEFIRRQVSTERSHMAAVRSACAAALAREDGATRDPAFLEACAEYLVFVVGRFNAQDQAHCDLLRPRLEAADAEGRATIDDLLQALAASREAIGRLATAVAAHGAGTLGDAPFVEALREYLGFYSRVLATRRHLIHHLFDRHYGIAEWRRASAVDADSILEERDRYARVADCLPEGLSLAPAEIPAAALRAALPAGSGARTGVGVGTGAGAGTSGASGAPRGG